VWKKEDIINTIKGSSFGLNVDPSTFDENNINLVLHYLQDDAIIVNIGKYIISNDTCVDIESYSRLSDYALNKDIEVSINNFIHTQQINRNNELIYKSIIRRFENESMALELIFIDYSAEFNYYLLRAIITKTIVSSLMERIAELYYEYKILFTISDILKTPAKSKFSSFKISEKSDRFIAYIDKDNLIVYNPKTNKKDKNISDDWFMIPITQLGFSRRHDENDIVVGFMESKRNVPSFKIRQPKHKMEQIEDARLLSKGIICVTYPRTKQIDVITKLDLMTKTEAQSLSCTELCVVLRNCLLMLELESRSTPDGMMTGIRWFYLFNELRPNL
jgi:hypothetical protein